MEVLNPIPTQVKKIIAIALIVFAVCISCFSGFAEVDDDIGSLLSFLPKSMLSVFEDMKLSHWELFTLSKEEEETESMVVILVIMLAVVGTGVLSGMQTWKGSKKAAMSFAITCTLSLGFDIVYISGLNDDIGFKFLELESSPLLAVIFAGISLVFTMAVAKDVEEGRAVAGGMSKEEMASMMNSAKEKAGQAATKAGQAASAAGAVAKEATSAASIAAKNAAQEQKAKQSEATSAPSAGGAFCPHCGKGVKADAAFCSSCGKTTK